MPAEADTVIQNKVAELIMASDGISPSEIEKVLGLTRGTVQSTLTRLTYMLPIYEDGDDRHRVVRVVKPMDWSDNGGAADET